MLEDRKLSQKIYLKKNKHHKIKLFYVNSLQINVQTYTSLLSTITNGISKVTIVDEIILINLIISSAESS